MRAVVITEHGGPEVLRVEERPGPAGRPGRGPDRRQGRGDQLRRPDGALGRLPGRAAAAVRGRLRGRRRGRERRRRGRALRGRRPGARRDPVRRLRGARQRAGRARCSRCPTTLSFEQGAAFPVNYATAYAGARDHGRAAPGERVLIHAAAGGVGIAATQIAKRDRRRDLRHRVGVQARRDPRAGRRPRDRLPQPGLRRRGDADHGRRGRRRDHRRGRPVELSQGLRDPARRAAGWSCTALSEVQTGEQARHPGGAARAWRGCRWRRCRGGRASR